MGPVTTIPVPPVFPVIALLANAVMVSPPFDRRTSIPLPVAVTVLSCSERDSAPVPPLLMSIPSTPAERTTFSRISVEPDPAKAAVWVMSMPLTLPAKLRPAISAGITSVAETALPPATGLSSSGQQGLPEQAVWEGLASSCTEVVPGAPLKVIAGLKVTVSPENSPIRCWPFLRVMPAFWPVVVPSPR